VSFIRVGAGSETLSPVETARAQELAFGFLHGDPDRWQHVQGVAVRAAELRPAVPATDGSLAGFPFAEDALTDALTYADQTVGPRGERLAVADRLAEAVRRRTDRSSTLTLSLVSTRRSARSIRGPWTPPAGAPAGPDAFQPRQPVPRCAEPTVLTRTAIEPSCACTRTPPAGQPLVAPSLPAGRTAPAARGNGADLPPTDPARSRLPAPAA
jgi:hypothetical protein